MNCIVDFVRRNKIVTRIIIPILIVTLGALVYPILTRTALEIAFDIDHKIQDQVHSFSFTIRNKGSENIKQGELVEMILLFRSNITKLVWYSAVSKEVVEDYCRGYKLVEEDRKAKIDYYHLKIKKWLQKQS